MAVSPQQGATGRPLGWAGRKQGGRMYSRWYGGNLNIYPGDAGPGHEYFVDSTNGSAENSGESWEQAMATIDQAVDKCTVAGSLGETIYVAPYHAENLAGDSAVDIDVAGVSVIGVRFGRQMPTLTATAAAGDLKLAAANVTVQNIRFLNGIDQCTGIVEIGAADCALLDCETRDSVDQSTDNIMVIAGAHRCLLSGIRCMSAIVAGPNSAIAINDADDIEISNFYLHGDFAVGAIDFRTAPSLRGHIHSGYARTLNTADVCIVDTVTGSTCAIGPDLALQAIGTDDNCAGMVTGATFHVLPPVYVGNTVNEKAKTIPWTEPT